MFLFCFVSNNKFSSYICTYASPLLHCQKIFLYYIWTRKCFNFKIFIANNLFIRSCGDINMCFIVLFPITILWFKKINHESYSFEEFMNKSWLAVFNLFWKKQSLSNLLRFLAEKIYKNLSYAFNLLNFGHTMLWLIYCHLQK